MLAYTVYRTFVTTGSQRRCIRWFSYSIVISPVRSCIHCERLCVCYVLVTVCMYNVQMLYPLGMCIFMCNPMTWVCTYIMHNTIIIWYNLTLWILYCNDIHSSHSTLHQPLPITHYLIVHYQHYMLANSSIKYCTTVSNPLQYNVMLW